MFRFCFFECFFVCLYGSDYGCGIYFFYGLFYGVRDLFGIVGWVFEYFFEFSIVYLGGYVVEINLCCGFVFKYFVFMEFGIWNFNLVDFNCCGFIDCIYGCIGDFCDCSRGDYL